LQVSPLDLVLGPTAFDAMGSASVSVSNPDSVAVTVQLSLLGDAPDLDRVLQLRPSEDLVLEPGQSQRLDLDFHPLSPDPVQARLLLEVEGATPVEVGITATVDPDGDDDGSPHPLAGGDDCDDTDPDIRPGATEIWYDGVDQDCDGRDDDADGDSFPRADDCDDHDARVYPGASDIVDGIDEDCDGVMDEDGAGPGTALLSELFVENHSTSKTWDRAFELYLKGGVGVEGWTLASDAGSGTLRLLDGATGPWLLLCSPADAVSEATCGAVVEPWPAPATSADGLVLSVQGVEVDAVRWTGAWGLAGGELQLDRGAAEGTDPAINDASSAWCAGLPSPGAENSSCP